MSEGSRFHLARCGVLNVWQYDRQVFDLADGRLLLRGANGAGKSKTMEMLLPFAIDGDKARLTASGRHHTSLLWLLLDGYDGQARTGYVWVEFSRTTDDGDPETVTCGVGMRATQSARTATAWYFTSNRRVGHDLHLEDDAGPLSRQQLEAEVTRDGTGQVFDQAVRYREHVGQLLFGLPGDQYDDLLRLIYWLRQPQVGEDIDPQRLAEQLVNALPQVDDAALRTAGDTFDELEAFGEQIERRSRAAEAIGRFVETYAGYSRSVVRERGTALVEADGQLRRRVAQVRSLEGELAEATMERDRAEEDRRRSRNLQEEAQARIGALESGPEARARARLVEMAKTVEALGGAARRAERHHTEALSRARRSADGADAEADALADAMATFADGVGAAARALDDVMAPAEAGVPGQGAALLGVAALARARDGLRWPDEDAALDLDPGLSAGREWLGAASTAVTRRQAAVTVVRGALDAAALARREADDATARETEAQERADAGRDLLEAARGSTGAAEQAFVTALDAWLVAAPAVTAFDVPDLDPAGLRALEGLARASVADEVEQQTAAAGRAETDGEVAVARREALLAERARVESEVDPLPPAPPWRRDARQHRAGAPFWRLVDVADDLSPDERAGLEAALEGAGLLDAWVDPEGRVDGHRLDVGLDAALEEGDRSGAASHTGGGATLALHLRVDSSADDPGVPPTVVQAVLDRVAVVVDGVAPDGPGLAVGTDGSWRAGPLRGRTTKETAQYLGAGARVAERRRRLALLDAQVAEAQAQLEDASRRAVEARDRLRRITAWLGSRPPHDAVLSAWATLEERETALERLEAELRELAARARERRATASARHAELVTAGDTHGLPVTADALRAREEALRALVARLTEHLRSIPELERALARWTVQAGLARDEQAATAAAATELEAAEGAWRARQQEHQTLVEAEGASVAELEARLSALRHGVEEHRGRVEELSRLHDALLARVGGLEATVAGARERVDLAHPQVEEARMRLAALDDLAGFVLAAFGGTTIEHGPSVEEPTSGSGGRDPASDETTDAGTGGSPAPGGQRHLGTMPVAAVRRLVAALPGVTTPERSRNAVLQSVAALLAGDAAVHEPRLNEDGGVLVAIGRDETGDLPVVELHQRLAAGVASDRELLTARERKLFEDHVLGQLGDALRSVRRKADELVHAMNEQLRDVTTSQGIRVRLRWRLRDDIAPEARRAVELLRQPPGALLPGERTELRESLHRLIEVSRAEAPEESYAVHLARALDYRRWNAFTVQYHRPEAGEWRDLHRRTALSQGEQKVLCYLPLFAAAAAHFTSVAGAAPYAPRFVLLDDAFPKIDVRTHPLLFGLLVDLDLDFVITSERLWGTHATVPRLAIYEALRSPGDRGIAQYEHRWDGQQLVAVGA
ncbi:hypothetical protein GCM10023168_21950 [Fodinibacter luteus]|uniref:TIGR02680 family protein n=1 Tax=Fodinibacter luteus TaxID=552064 RepID=A0ABP8KHE4_9MICO